MALTIPFRFPSSVGAGIGRPFVGTKRTPEGQWQFRFLYHPEASNGRGLWFIDMSTMAGDLLLAGLPLVHCPDLLRSHRARKPQLPTGLLVGNSRLNPPQDPRRYDLGVTFDLSFVYA